MPNIILFISERQTLSHTTRVLEDAGFTVSGHTQPEQAIRRTASVSADLVIVDTAMPRMGAGALIRRLSDTQSVPVLAMLHARNELDEVRYLKDGAADVIERSASSLVLVARVEALLRRAETVEHAHQGSMLDQPVLRVGPLFMQPSKLAVRWFNQEVELTKTEFGILYALAAHPEMIRTRNFLQDLTDGEDIHAMDRAIDSHIKRVRQKLRSVDPDFDGIQTIYGLGYSFRLAANSAPRLALAG